jgi:hypothetical protein
MFILTPPKKSVIAADQSQKYRERPYVQEFLEMAIAIRKDFGDFNNHTTKNL